MSPDHQRLEVDREDLLAEATALVERIELTIEGRAEPVVVGFRREGGVSVYFGADPAYHFNAAGELRRAFCDGLLYKADGGRLASLNRQRTEEQVMLVRRDLDDEQQYRFVGRVARELLCLRDAIEAGRFAVRGEVSASGDVLASVRQWLADFTVPPRVARRPNAR